MKKSKEELLQCFEDLEQNLAELDRIVKWLKDEDQKMANKFKDDSEYVCYMSPLSAVTGYDFEKKIIEVNHSSCNFVVRQMEKVYKNITLDEEDIWMRFKETGFFPTAVYGYINLLCLDEDAVALKQIKDACIELLPFDNFGNVGPRQKANKPEHIRKNKVLQLHEHVYYDKLYHGTKRVKALVNFIHITLEGASPADVEPPQEILNEPGVVMYQDEFIKSIRAYKNGNLKVTFRGVPHAIIISEALTNLVGVKNAID